MSRIVASLGICAISSFCYSQELISNIGGRNAGLAGAALVIPDSYSIINNVGALSFTEKSSAFAGYQNRFGISELQTVYGGFTTTFKNLSTAIGLVRFGGELFNQQQVTAGISNNFQLVSLGVSATIVQFQIQDLETSHSYLISFGGLAKLLPQFHVAGNIRNINQARISKEINERIPTRMQLGISYLPSDEIQLNLQVDKSTDQSEMIKLGLEYQLIEFITLRTGISSKPMLIAFGFGTRFSKFELDYSYNQAPPLGVIHDISMQLYIGK